MSNDSNPLEKDKKQILRSAAYPSITIEDAINFVAELKKSFPNTMFNRDDIVAVLKRTTIIRDTAAAVQYALLEKTIGEGYKLSATAKIILNPISEQEKQESIIQCFNAPKLYIELVEKFKGHAIPGDQQLKAILNRHHNITEAAAGQAVEIFIENAKFSGLMNDNRILLESFPTMAIETVVEEPDKEENSEKALINESSIVEDSQPVVKSPLFLEEMNDSITLKIHLTQKKFAQLVYPGDINEKDIQILTHYLEALALTL